MDLGLLLSLAGLALVDSTSFGTLLIPLWLMTSAAGLRPGRVLAFLAVVGGFYLAVGAGLLLGGAAVLGQVDRSWLDSTAALVVQAAVGVALFAASFKVGPGTGARLGRWRDRAVGGEGSVRGVVTLALVAATLEVATMLPYLGAIGLLAASGEPVPLQVGVLVAYCLVMLVPALVLLGGRLVVGRRAEPVLGRVSGWLERAGGEATAWVLGIAGFLIGASALSALLS